MDSMPKTLGGLLKGSEESQKAFHSLETGDWSKIELKASGLPSLARDDVENAISDALGDALNIDIADIFIGAWKKLKDLQPYRDRKAHPPGEIALVPLVDHSIRSTHKPTIEITLGDQLIFEIVFDVDITLQMEGFVLKIRDASITEVLSGQFKAKGSLKYRTTVLLSKETRKFKIPGHMEINPAVPIPELP